MGKFTFSMERQLVLKQKMERQRQIELALMMKRHEEAMNKLLEAKLSYTDSLEGLRKKLNSARLDRMAIETQQASIHYFKDSVSVCAKNEAQCQKDVDQKRQRLTKALQERKMYETLREKAYEVYLQEEKLNEAKIIDEVVTYKYAKDN